MATNAFDEETAFAKRDFTDQLSAWCGERLGSTVAEVLFTVRRLGTVIGVVLSDGRRVVVKLDGAVESIDRRRAAQRVQGHLFREGFPCPRPILEPSAFGLGTALVEELVEAGPAPNAHQPKIRRVMAEALAWQMRITSTIKPPKALERTRPSWIDLRTGGLWPPPHHAKLDFEAREPVVEWIDQTAARAKRVFLKPTKAAGPSRTPTGKPTTSDARTRICWSPTTGIASPSSRS